MFDLLCSLLKLCSMDSNLLQQQPGFCVSAVLRMICGVAVAAVAHVDLRAGVSAAAQAAGAPPAVCADLQTAAAAATTTQAGSDVLCRPTIAADTSSGAAAPPVEQHRAAAAAQGSSTCRPSPTVMLPWLVLLGRCCLLWARWLQQLSTVEVTSGQGQPADQRPRQIFRRAWGPTQAAAAADPWSVLPAGAQWVMRSTPVSKLHCAPADDGGTMGLSAVIKSAAASAYGWLTAGSNMQQLADLGYNLQPLLAALVQLQADTAAIKTARHELTEEQPGTDAGRAATEATNSAERTSVIRLCPQLQVVGQALTAFAFPLACNNPGCVNASGPSEARLVRGKACVCGGCLTARYCSRACLKQHWKEQHKPVCKALAAAAAAASQAAASVSTQANG